MKSHNSDCCGRMIIMVPEFLFDTVDPSISPWKKLQALVPLPVGRVSSVYKQNAKNV